MSGKTLAFPLPLPIVLGPWVLPQGTQKVEHSEAASPGDSLLEGKCLPGHPEGLQGGHSCWAVSRERQTSLVTEKPTPGDT